MNFINTGVGIGGIMALNDVISMSLTKEIVIGNLTHSWLILPVILYGVQMLLFYYGIHITNMAILNLTWNLFSIVVITLIGIYYFKENVNYLQTYGILFALVSLFLFSLAQYQIANN